MNRAHFEIHPLTRATLGDIILYLGGITVIAGASVLLEETSTFCVE